MKEIAYGTVSKRMEPGNSITTELYTEPFRVVPSDHSETDEEQRPRQPHASPHQDGLPSGAVAERALSQIPLRECSTTLQRNANQNDGSSQTNNLKAGKRTVATNGPLKPVTDAEDAMPSSEEARIEHRINTDKLKDPAEVIAWVKKVFSEGDIATATQLAALIKEASDANRNEFDEESARNWAEGYTFPQRYLDSDKECLRAAQLNFISMVRRRLKLLSPNRLNDKRIDAIRPDNPERTLLRELARGMEVARPEGFRPNGNDAPTPLRATYVSVAPAVNKMLVDLVDQKLAFLIDYDTARKYIPDLHLCKAHWTRKKGKASGRPLGDLTFVDGTPLNTPETAAAAAAHYGAIEHPTIEHIAQMICEFWAKASEIDHNASWEDLRMWKMDLKGAYTLLSFKPEDVGLFGMLLTDNLVYLQIAGIFGWSGTPAAFQVVT